MFIRPVLPRNMHIQRFKQTHYNFYVSKFKLMVLSLALVARNVQAQLHADEQHIDSTRTSPRAQVPVETTRHVYPDDFPRLVPRTLYIDLFSRISRRWHHGVSLFVCLYRLS